MTDGSHGRHPFRRLRRRVRRLRRRAWERGEQRYYRHHSAEVEASLRHSYLRQIDRASRHAPAGHHPGPDAGEQRDARRPADGARGPERWLTVAMVTLATAGGALAGCHPTGTPVVDPIETALFAAGFTLLVSRAASGTWLVVGATAVLFARGWLLVPATGTLLVALAGVVSVRARPWAGPIVGALGVQVVLRWPATFFHGFPAVLAAALVVVCGLSAWGRSSRRTRRRATKVLVGVAAVAALFTVVVGIATLRVRAEAFSGEAAAHRALANVGSGSSMSVVADLGTAAADTSHAAGALDSWYTAGGRVVPVVAQQQRFLAGTLRSASSAAAVGHRQASAIDVQLGSEPGQVDVSRLEALATPMRILDRQLHATDGQLASLGSPWLVGPLQDRANSFRRQLTQATHSVDLGVEATRVLPAMLGADGTRQYLIAFMTPSESRGYDGLVGSYGLLTAEAGHFSLTDSGSISDIQDALPTGGAQLSGVADYLQRYGPFDPGSNPQDVMYSPDLPTDANVFAQMYAQSIGGPIDGVLAIDPYGLAALLHFTGPIEVPGLPFPLTAGNAAQVLLTQQYTTFDTGLTNQDLSRHDFLLSALHTAFHDLVSRSLPAPKEVSAVLDPTAVAGQISFWSFHADEQPFLRQIGVDGSFPTAGGGDLLAVTTDNAGNNKIDAFLHTSIVDRISFDPGTGAERSTVQVSLTNDAPASGLPPIVIASPGEPSLAPGTNETWLTVYSPLSFGQVAIDGSPATMSSTPELGVWAYSTYVQVAPGATTTVRVDLLGDVDARSTLTMSVRLQPSANPERARVVVVPAGSWSLATGGDPAGWDLGPAMRQSRVFRFVGK
ncbi:MAG: DUF4012 domain-containing protein [Acidimicrobiales bacterium]